MRKKVFIGILGMVGIACISQSQFLTMENIPQNWKTENSKLSISNKHYKIGNISLQWNYKKGGKLIINNPPFLEQAIKINRSGPQFWIYNEVPINDSIKVSFISEKGIEKYYYFKLNFKGWRANAVPFFTMKGNPKWQSIPFQMIVQAPIKKEGVLYIGRFRFSPAPFNIRMTNDAQIDCVDTQKLRSHWTALWYWYQNYPLPVASKTITEEQEKELQIIINRINDYAKTKLLKSANLKRIQEIQDSFSKFNIKKDKSGNITGKVFVGNDEYYPQQGDGNWQDFGKMLLQLTSLWKLTNNSIYKNQVYDVLDQMIDQGYDVGSGCGTNHHFGYTYREMFPVFWAMREEMIIDKKSDKYFPIYAYWSGLAETRKKMDITEIEGIPDFWNTMLIHRLAACFMTTSKEEQWRNISMLKNYVNTTLQISPGVWTGIKKDGSIFHHGGLYPAYACDGLGGGFSPYIDIVKNTSIMPDSIYLENLKKAILALGQYTAYDEWGFGLCGRHPLGRNFSKAVIPLIGNMAIYKNYPKIDTALAGLYLRWENKHTKEKSFLEEQGLKPDTIYNQFTVMNHGAVGIQRRGNWQVLMKGYNRFVWGSEIYEKANRYGRYQSYGTVQIVGNGNPVNNKESGYVQEGWDWNHYPGATNIVLPLDSLECVDTFVMMDKSHSRFAGASCLNQNGVFAIDIRESSFPRFTPSFRAKKSVFAFDSVLIYLGSNINNDNELFPTQTTLFQISEKPEWFVENNNIKIDTKKNGLQTIVDTNNGWISDIQGNVYYFPKTSGLVYSYQNQKSQRNDNKTTTEGVFKMAYINHGVAPKNASYEYAVKIKGANSKDAFIKSMNEEKLYQVIEKNQKNHIVYYYSTKTTGFVFFEGNDNVKDSLLKSINMASLVMVQPLDNNNTKYTISVCQPDLNLNKDTIIPVEFHGPAEYSTPQMVIMTLNKEWILESAPTTCSILQNTGNTIIEITCKDGEPVQFNISKKIK